MNLQMRQEPGREYTNRSQVIRVITEAWASRQLFCAACAENKLVRQPGSTPAVDFVCGNCGAEYQLKSRSKIGRKIVDGAYSTMKERVDNGTQPNLLVLKYEPDLKISDLFLVPSFFFFLTAIEARKPLSSNAKRAGWQGCNILLDMIPSHGRIQIVTDGRAVNEKTVVSSYDRLRPLVNVAPDARGWLMNVLHVIETLPSKSFRLVDVYASEGKLASLHPENNNVRAKIRQQLQVLRDKGILTFLGGGRYLRTV